VFLSSKKSKVRNLSYPVCFRWCCLAFVLAVAERKRVLVIAIILAIPATAGSWINHFWPAVVPPPVFLVGGPVLISFVIVYLLRFILRAPSVTPEVITLSIVGYGDITPVSRIARRLARWKRWPGCFMWRSWIARLVSLYSSSEI